MSADLLTGADPTIIAIGIGIVAVVAIAGYLWWAWSEGKWPFSQ